jgi:hypothetical protein
MKDETDQYWEIAKEITENTLRYSAMQGSRDRWRSVAMQLADQLYKRSPHLPDLDAFYSLLNDPFDGDGVNGN